MSAMWTFLVVLAAGIALLVGSLVGRGDAGRARSILAERLARGELTPEQYREHLSLIGAGGTRARWILPAAVGLVVLGLIGAVAAGGIAMGRGEMGWMMGGSDEMMMDMMGGDTGRRADAPRQGAPEYEVKAIDFSFSPRTLRIPAGETANVVLRNAGANFHTYTVEDLDFELRAKSDDDVSASLRVRTAGRYKVICAVSGHERMGMTGTLVAE